MRELILRGYVVTLLRLRVNRDERGASMVEYGLLIALIAGVVVVTVGAIGTNIETQFKAVCNKIGGGATC
jgi:pilus assembly protein Flp/PilA